MPAKREPEAPFAILIAVADPLIAAGLGEDGHHVIAKADLLGRIEIA